MYHNKMVVCIKHNGKILRENKDLVNLPFGSEFTVLVKNLSSRRAQFSLHIDGVDVLSGTKILVNPNSETEIKRFMNTTNSSEGNAFKFIERTESIENGPRGIRADDGIVRVEYWYEKEQPIYRDTVYRTWYERHPWKDVYYTDKFYAHDQLARDKTLIGHPQSVSSTDANLRNEIKTAFASGVSVSAQGVVTASTSAESYSAPGITVPGSKVKQEFSAIYGFAPEAHSDTIILRLSGYRGEKPVEVAVTTKTKQKCITCGKVNKSTAKFCSDCGTALEII